MNKTNSRGILLASFITSDSEEDILTEVENIANTFYLSNNMIFLLKITDAPEKKIITYNALIEKGKPLNTRLFTMRVHRKKNTNTLYTINALNAAVAKDNNGETGKHLKLDWEQYRNSVMLLTGSELKTHPVEVLRVFKVETSEEPEE
jgi:hypothetical protein|tara:strand:+ start:1438 stop:1881 length:444 start_codon:yes stop_codon:yes gene_type:complete